MLKCLQIHTVTDYFEIVQHLFQTPPLLCTAGFFAYGLPVGGGPALFGHRKMAQLMPDITHHCFSNHALQMTQLPERPKAKPPEFFPV